MKRKDTKIVSENQISTFSWQECGELSSVLLYRPGIEFKAIEQNPAMFSFNSSPDIFLAREQHDALADLYRKNGIQVYYLENSPDLSPNLVFIRDNFSLTPKGAIIGKLASRHRVAEEKHIKKFFERKGIPILACLGGDEIFECGDLIIVDKDLALLAQSRYSNKLGVYRIHEVLREIGISEIITVQLSEDVGHLDEIIAIIDIDKIFGVLDKIPKNLLDVLNARNFEFINAENFEEVTNGMVLNLVTLSPGKVILPSGNPKTLNYLRSRDIVCLEASVSEFILGGGAVRCLTGILKKAI